ncbi:hypothetical protein XENORESO_021158 [Xenotaenia resolanae]|uniref:Uncharacterized protein n=1 Tax=Xenotaenia resolanae TaxID=208358 RepID=A0ABV0WZY6_9TELE
MSNLKCLHRHLSGWHSVVLKRRIRMGKAVALCDWRRQLKAWQAWRAVVWAERNQREVARTEEQLRTEKRQVMVNVKVKGSQLAFTTPTSCTIYSALQKYSC